MYYLQSRYYNPEISRFINADAFAATGPGLLGNNMFAYCLNNPVVMIDAFGTDAIYVVGYILSDNGLPVFGHAYVFIQDGNGTWYMVQFTADFPHKSTARIEVYAVEGSKYEELFNKVISNRNIFGTEYTYFEGDFTKSLDYARELLISSPNYGGYDLLENNCLHFSQDVLSKGSFISNLEEQSVKKNGNNYSKRLSRNHQ